VTFDESLLLAGVVLAVLTLFVGIWAAVFATRADVASRHASRQSDQRYLAQVQPRPQLTFRRDPNRVGGIAVTVSNTGGAALYCLIVAQVEQLLCAFHGPLPQHAPPRDELLRKLETTSDRTAKVLLDVAQDIQGHWWDVLLGRQINQPVASWFEIQATKLKLPLRWQDLHQDDGA